MQRKKFLICIIGGSGSGKSTLEDEIVLHDGFSKAISTTTRDKRVGEHDGREYNFVTVNEFEQLKEKEKLLESVLFSGNYYGLSKSELEKNADHLVLVVEPNGYLQIKKYIEKNNLNISTLVIFMDITEKERFKNMVKRGDSSLSIQERLMTETIVSDFKSFEIKPNIRITKLHNSTNEIVMSDIKKLIS